jgi:hypothetical protein
MSDHLERINYVKDLSQDEKDHLLELLIDRLGCELRAIRLSEEDRIIQLVARDRL